MKRIMANYKGEFRILLIFLGFFAFILLGIVLKELQQVVLPLVLAVFGSIIVNPIIDFGLKIKKNRIIEILMIMIVLIMVFFMINFFGYLSFVSLKKIALGLPNYDEKLRLLIEQLMQQSGLAREVFSRFGIELESQWDVGKILEQFSLSGLLFTVFNSIVSIISNTFLVIVFMLFLLLGRGNMERKLEKIFPGTRIGQARKVIREIKERIQRYLIAKTIISIITGVLAGVVLVSYKVDFAITWAILTILLNFIPSIGSIIATVLPVSVAFLSTGTYYPALPVFIFLALIQTVIGNFIDPNVIGDVVDLSPIAILTGLIILGWLWGIVGMFLAVPILVSLKLVFESVPSTQFISVLMSGRRRLS